MPTSCARVFSPRRSEPKGILPLLSSTVLLRSPRRKARSSQRPNHRRPVRPVDDGHEIANLTPGRIALRGTGYDDMGGDRVAARGGAQGRDRHRGAE